MPLIELETLSRIHQQGSNQVFTLRGVNLTIEKGEFVSIMGPSGAGKSTLLHILGLLDAPTSGTYRFKGQNVERLSERERTALHRTEIGFVFQAYHLIDDLTVYENLEAPLLYAKVPKEERQGRVATMLDRFGLAAKRDLFPSQLSGGQQQIVGVARALVIEPSLILADEPTGNLHARQGEEVMTLLRELHEEGVTVIHVTHSEHWAGYGTRVLELVDGRIVADRAPIALEG